MAIEKMSLWSVEGPTERLDAAIMACCESEAFEFWQSSSRSQNEQNPYQNALSRVKDLAQNLGIKPKKCEFSDVKQETAADFEDYAGDVLGRTVQLFERREKTTAQLEEHRHTDGYVKHLLGLNVTFKELFTMKYVKIRIGRLPLDNEAKLGYYTKKCFIFMPFERESEYVYGIYLVPTNVAEFADDVFDSLGFERTRLPNYLKDDAQTAERKLAEQIAQEENELKKIDAEFQEIKKQVERELSPILCKLKFKSDCYELRKKALISGDWFSFSGFAPTSEGKKLAELLEKASDEIVADEIPITGKTRADGVPVKLKNNRLVKPFEMFTNMYGLPGYGEFDPTPYVAVTYMLMFGIMFGDVGQGLLVSALGFIISRFSRNALAPIMIRLGFFSAAFGCVYGSVFGIESIIKPIYHRKDIWRGVCKALSGLGIPEEPENIFEAAMAVLVFALFVGVVLILLSMIFNMIKNFKIGRLPEALFSVNGAAGIVMYASLMAGVALTLLGGVEIMTAPYVICLIVLPVACIFLKNPLTKLILRKPAEKFSFAESFIDLFEGAISFLSNTMSYLRIGGFVLSHAGFMLVVSQLAGTAKPGAEVTVTTVITYIIGNILVMGIEGLLSGIQVLRLEFYEVFSRFYEGGGRVFTPVKINMELD